MEVCHGFSGFSAKMRRRFGRWRGATPVRAVACWHGDLERIGVSVCRRCATGCCGSTRRGRPVLSTARRRGRRRSSTRPSARRLPGLSRAGRSRRTDRSERLTVSKQTLSSGTASDGFPQAVRPAASGAERTRRSKKLPRPRGGYCTAQRSRRTNRIGQKNKITRRWARRGTRPRAPHDQRTRCLYLRRYLLVLPFCNNDAMALHLQEISRTVAPRAHAVRSRLAYLGQARCARPCRHARPSSIRSRTSGSSCATTGCPTASSIPTTTSSTIAATPGTSWSISPGKSCRSDTVNGRIGRDQWDLVLVSCAF